MMQEAFFCGSIKTLYAKINKSFELSILFFLVNIITTTVLQIILLLLNVLLKCHFSQAPSCCGLNKIRKGENHSATLAFLRKEEDNKENRMDLFFPLSPCLLLCQCRIRISFFLLLCSFPFPFHLPLFPLSFFLSLSLSFSFLFSSLCVKS